MNKKRLILGIILVIFLSFMLYRCQSNDKQNDQTITVKKGTIEEKVVAVGSIIPKHTVSIKSTIPGIVGQLFHEEGDFVNQGTLLLQILPAPTPQNIAEAYGNVKEQMAIVKQTEDHQKRLEKLVKLQIETPDRYAIALKDLSTAQAKLELAEQKLSLLQKGETVIAGQNIKTTIANPIDGYILKRNVAVGDSVVPLTEAQAGTVLFIIANMQDLIFKGEVNEIDVSKISENMLANISIAALPDVKIQGTLNKVGLQSTKQNNQNNDKDNKASNDDGSSPFNVGFDIELNQLQLPKNMKLRSGYSATAEITIKHVENTLIIPERVLIFKDNKIFVNLPQKKNKMPKQQEIKIGISDGINVQVLQGLKEGDIILDNNILIST